MDDDHPFERQFAGELPTICNLSHAEQLEQEAANIAQCLQYAAEKFVSKG